MEGASLHPILGRLVFMPDECRWIGEIEHKGWNVELNLNTYRPDQIPGLHVTELIIEFCQAFQMVKPHIDQYMREAAIWICSKLQVWFEPAKLEPNDMFRRLKLSTLVLRPDASAWLWIDEPTLYETGHSVGVRIGTDGKIDHLELA